MKTYKISVYLQGKLDDQQTASLFQNLIDSGEVWHLQGAYGRTAMDLIRAGLCTLGPKPTRDAWGNRVPSKFEVKSGTIGSESYAKSQRKHLSR